MRRGLDAPVHTEPIWGPTGIRNRRRAKPLDGKSQESGALTMPAAPGRRTGPAVYALASRRQAAEDELRRQLTLRLLAPPEAPGGDGRGT